MKVWVVFPNYGDGYGDPEGVFSSPDFAQAWVKLKNRYGTSYEIDEFEIDDPDAWMKV